MVIHQLHGIERVPPCTSRTQQLLRCKAHLLFFSYSEQLKFLLQNTKPMLRIQRFSSRREREWVCFQEVLVRIGPLRAAGTTPVPAIASVTPMGKATNRLG